MRLFKRIGSVIDRKPLQQKLFSNIVGYDDLKELVAKTLISKEPVHVLLTGPPATAKTIFLLEIDRNMKNTYFVDATNSSGAGTVDYLFENPDTEFLLVDEIDKLDRKNQTNLYNVMETGILSQIRVKKSGGYRQQKMKLRIFGTCNEISRLNDAFRSRFMVFKFPEYTLTEFISINQKLLGSRYNASPEVSMKISKAVWSKMKTRDIRDCLNIAKLTTDSAEVDRIVDTMMKYRLNED